MKPLRIALVVQGRFHAFDLARTLTARGHDVTVFTNYPAWAARRFGLDPAAVRSAWTHGAVSRALPHLPAAIRGNRTEAWLHQGFGRWAAREVGATPWDVIHTWSGVSEELLLSPHVKAGCRLLMRGSSHIVEQDRLLSEEAARTGTQIDRPSAWMIARELREYAAADRVLVLSSFARDSFVRHGYPPDRLDVLPLGVDVRAFRPDPEAVRKRAARIRSGAPLRVLYVGALSARKGLWDLVELANRLGAERFGMTLAGPALAEAQPLISRLPPWVRVVGKVPQHELPALYQDADLFVFPTIEDGFGMVLTQAKAAGLPILSTAHCAAADLLRDGCDGWLLPVRDAAAFAGRLKWCDEHREELSLMTEAIVDSWLPRDWSDVAVQFEEMCMASLALRLNGAYA